MNYEEIHCIICGKKFKRRTKTGKLRRMFNSSLRPKGCVTCSRRCSAENTHLLKILMLDIGINIWFYIALVLSGFASGLGQTIAKEIWDRFHRLVRRKKK